MIGFICFIIFIIGICVIVSNHNSKTDTKRFLKEKIENYDSLIHFHESSSKLPILSYDKNNTVI